MITITEAAARQIQAQADKRGTPTAAIRLGLRGGGCNGFSYLFDWDESGPGEGDHVIQQHGVTVYVDARSMQLLSGTVLDFTAGVMGHGFKFNNPNVKSSCGCGESVGF
jgi:iron-sulfur cluster assembly protein